MPRGSWPSWFMIMMSLVALMLSSCSGRWRALSQQDCLNQMCDGVRVSYPFKLSNNTHCPSYDSSFDLDCQLSQGQERLYLNNITNITNYLYLNNITASGYSNAAVPRRVLHIDFDGIIVDSTGLNASFTTLPNGSCIPSTVPPTLALPPYPSPFFFSDDNLFGSFGCSVLGVIASGELLSDASMSKLKSSKIEIGGCYVLCPGEDEVNPICGGRACCNSSLTSGISLRDIAILVQYPETPNPINQCSSMYSTIFYPGKYTNFSRQTYGVKLGWALPSNQSIEDIKQSPEFACSDHSNPTIVPQVPGYYCSCQHGFQGDGYAQGLGCADIHECASASLNNCTIGKSTCHEKEGAYTCKCNSIFHVGDGLKSGSGCTFSPMVIAIVCAIVFVGLVICGVPVLAVWWKRRVKRKYFLQNGGVQLQDVIAKAGGRRQSRLFTAEELKSATENYAEHMKLGIGGFGTVYKGILADGQLVAIKKANLGTGKNEDFLNELKILLHINHRNIIRLLGCCMETAVPLLVYEYVSHGTVRQNLDAKVAGVVGWEQRLKVAKQTAEALAYLHAAAFPPILHRDVKSSNVLLDDNLDAKVADFGASRLVPEGMQHVSTAVQGTVGYLDPEYFQTLQLTDKSDVYSLGVMLLELISGQKPIDRCREPQVTSLSVLFIKCMQDGRVEELIDPFLIEPSTVSSHKALDGMTVQVRSSIMAVAALALQCLSIQGTDRPSMSTVADELRHIARALEEANHGNDGNKDSSSASSKDICSEQVEAGAVVVHNADEVFKQSASTTTSIGNLNIPTLPR
ncbi:hypothetical protein GOP47_0027944 [Adiantum capillus-veneris]|nr:hypothetical protein GOP47_0027944 [Adiantum capillus-veneris]